MFLEGFGACDTLSEACAHRLLRLGSLAETLSRGIAFTGYLAAFFLIFNFGIYRALHREKRHLSFILG
jgi:hypothetical protein